MNPVPIRTARTIPELRQALQEIRQQHDCLGVVPTMGALHDGHLSLVRHSRERCAATVVTIFVNPAQFAAGEDLDQYPRPEQQDLRLLHEAEVDLVFLPDAEQVYPPHCTTQVSPPHVAKTLEGAIRPTHFAGVATVVLKLFNLTGADVAFFGQKDYQQSLVVKHMVRDLNLPVEIVVCPVVRDTDGVALSSRNAYLSREEREIARSLHRTLGAAAERILHGHRDGQVLMQEMTGQLEDAGVSQVDYAVIADTETLEPMTEVTLPAVLLVAARVGQTRLIDNVLLTGRR
jgi:pantoate--beta-alanine ligase